MSEDEELETLKKWWKENGTTAVTGVVLGLGIVFGFGYWQSREQTRAEQASILYESALDMSTARDVAEAAIRFDQLMEQYPDSTYGTLAAFVAANDALRTNNSAEAERRLRWVLANGSTEDFRNVARLRIAKLNLSAGEHEVALKLLEEVTPTAFAAQVHELRGDIHLAQGNVNAAREAYEKALEPASDTDKASLSEDGVAEPPAPENPRIRMKLDDLGHEDEPL